MARAMERLAGADAARRLGDDRTDSEERLHALLELKALGSRALAQHSAVVAQCLQDPDWQVRSRAAEALVGLEPEVLQPHAADILSRFRDEDAEVRRAALGLLEKNMHWLESPNCAVRLAAVGASRHLSAVALAANVFALLKRLKDDVSEIRVAAAEALADVKSEHLPPQEAKWVAAALIDALGDKQALVRRSAVLALGAISGALIAAVDSLAKLGLADSDPAVGAATVEVLARLNPDVHFELLNRHCQSTLLHHAARLGCNRVVETLATQQRTMCLHAKDGDENTALHVASMHGKLEACQVLARSGAMPKIRNAHGQSPLDLAEKFGHAQVADFFRRREKFTTVRGGAGDAMYQALSDPRCVQGLEWYTIALPGMAGGMGGTHSVLAITVGVSNESSHTYVIEKATVMRGVDEDEDPDQFVNGVYVSNWIDVAPSIEGQPIHVLQGVNVQNCTGSKEFTMRTLRAISVNLGDYHVASCNCHHGAMAVYNACAREDARVVNMPNQLLTWGAKLMSFLGLDADQSESMGSGSDSRLGHLQSRSLASQLLAQSTSVQSKQSKKSSQL